MKKTLALVLALAMVFSSITVAFAEGTIGADAQITADLGMLKGSTGTVDAAYVATAPTRIQAAVMFLRLKGLEAEAKAFTGTANFADADKAAWAKPIMAYLKANPQLGWQGDGTNFDPTGLTTAQAYYKVLLETLGYKQTTPTVIGDFAYADVLTFAAGKGLSKVATVVNYTVNDLAIATVEALKANTKDGGKTLVASLVEAGKVDNAKAVAAGLIVVAPATVTAALDSATALGNTVVEVTFDADVDAKAAANVASYAIEGLAVNAAVVVDADTVRLETAAQTAGTLYTLKVGTSSASFTGIAKVGAPTLDGAASADIEEVVLTFSKNIDFATGTNVANYAIDGVQIAKAEVDGVKVTLTTVGLVAKKQYTVKVTNIESVDGSLLKSASKSFYTRPDTTAPKFTNVVAETNQRLVLTFDQKITKASAENIANYTIKTVVGETPLAVLSAVLSSDSLKVTLTTEVQTANKKYEISVLGIADQTKAANAIKTAQTQEFYGKREDTAKPAFDSAAAVSRDLIKVTFTDVDSKLDETTILDVNNYTLKKGTEELVVESAAKVSSALGKYVALLTVEDMGVGSYNLEADNIADEFGNTLSDAKKYFSVELSTFASAAIIPSGVVVVDKNTITVEFDKELKEASAENIANYSIDGNIGTPISATYSDADLASDVDTNPNYVVTLKVNDLLDNVEYEVTVDGVEDLAGNALNASASDTNTGWDLTAPKLQDAYSVNKDVVALVFNEAIASSVVGNATAIFRPTSGSNITLTAKALSSDDTVVEFSAVGSVYLANNVTYSVYSVTGIKDVAIQSFATPANITDYKVAGTAEAADQAEVVSIEQVNGRTFKLTMSKDVLILGGGAVASVAPATPGSFVVSYDGTAKDVLKVVASANIAENAEYKLNLSSVLTDEHGTVVLDEYDTAADASKLTTFYAEYADGTLPYIVNVVAKDRTHVEIEYSEYITVTGAYKVVNADSSVSTTDIAGLISVSKNKVTITLTAGAALQAIYDYDLIINTAAATDYAGNADEETATDSFSFSGTDLAQ